MDFKVPQIEGPKPIFIIGVCPRSGTNFLRSLLALHPDCEPFQVPEDHFLYFSSELAYYVTQVGTRYPYEWEVPQDRFKAALLQSIGTGILTFAQAQYPKKRILLKTPWTIGLDSFPSLFSQAQLILLVRDGRATAESAVATNHKSGMTYKKAFLQWAHGAHNFLKYINSNRNNTNHILVKYEDLILNLDSELNRILNFLNLDPSVFQFEKAKMLPVIGSSTVPSSTRWVQPIPRGRDFDPLSRFSHWEKPLHERFNKVGGRYLEWLGYKPITMPQQKRHPSKRSCRSLD